MQLSQAQMQLRTETYEANGLGVGLMAFENPASP